MHFFNENVKLQIYMCYYVVAGVPQMILCKKKAKLSSQASYLRNARSEAYTKEVFLRLTPEKKSFKQNRVLSTRVLI